MLQTSANECESNGSNHCQIPTCPQFLIWIDTINTQLLVVLLYTYLRYRYPIIVIEASSSKRSSISDADEHSTRKIKTVDL